MNNKLRGLNRLHLAAAAALLLAPAVRAAFDSAAAPTDSHLKINRVVPEATGYAAGTADRGDFRSAVVALGAMAVDAAHAPVTISPQVECQWHWLDPRSLACELNAAQALAPATRYTVTVESGLKALDEATLEEPYRWTFTTERPAVKGYSFKTWQSPGMPVVRLISINR